MSRAIGFIGGAHPKRRLTMLAIGLLGLILAAIFVAHATGQPTCTVTYNIEGGGDWFATNAWVNASTGAPAQAPGPTDVACWSASQGLSR